MSEATPICRLLAQSEPVSAVQAYGRSVVLVGQAGETQLVMILPSGTPSHKAHALQRVLTDILTPDPLLAREQESA